MNSDIQRNTYSPPDKKEWLDNLVRYIETLQEEGKNISFKITGLKEKGFLIKVCGLYAFISFHHMPWKYKELDSWQIVYPMLLSSQFYGRIYKIQKEPLSIIVNGDIPQFKKAELKIGVEYTGVIIKKSTYGIFVDIGYHFDWKCGSLLGLLHKSQIVEGQQIEDYIVGTITQTTYQGINEDGHLIFGNDDEGIEWYLGRPQRLVGQIVWVKISKNSDNNEMSFLVKGQYKGKIIIEKNCQPKFKEEIIRALNVLKDGKIITCEVIGFNEKNRILKLKWLIEIDTEIILDYSIMNNLDEDTLQKLKTLKNDYIQQINMDKYRLSVSIK